MTATGNVFVGSSIHLKANDLVLSPQFVPEHCILDKLTSRHNKAVMRDWIFGMSCYLPASNS
jgi:hypothetical protein